MALTRRLTAMSRRVAKRTAFRVMRPMARHLPVGSGPLRWRRLAARVRVAVALRLLRRDTWAAEETVRPLLNTPASGRAHYVTALAREKRRDYSGALDAARQATRALPNALEPLLTHRALAARSGLDGEAREQLERLVVIPPRHARHLSATLDALSGADPELTERYLQTLHSRQVHFAPERVREVESELRLMELHGDRAAYPEELRRIAAERKRPVHVITHALSACQAWDELARFLDDYLADRAHAHGSLPRRELRAAAMQSFGVGNTSAAVSIARHVLDLDPGDRTLQAKVDDGADQLAVGIEGWPELPPPGETPYEPATGAVISVLAQSVPFTSGGYATRSHGILTGLAAHGWDMSAVTRLGFPHTWWRGTGDRRVTPLDVVDGVPYHRLLEDGVQDYRQYPLRSFIERYTGRLAEQAVEHRAGLIHASSFYINGLAGAAAARRLGLPFIYEMRGLEELMQVSRDPAFEGSDRHRFLAAVELAACRDADAVFVITEALGREMVSRGVPEERIVVLPNGVHVDRFTPRDRDADLARELGVTGKTVIGYAGGLVDYEGLDLLLRAAAALQERRHDFHVVVVGDGHQDQSLRGIAERLRLGDIITFTGRVPHAEVDRYLSLFDITPFPRLPLPVCELISPIKPFESMAMGRAVVASDVAALAEIVDDGRTGLLFEKGSAEGLTGVLERLLDAPDLRASLGRAAREWVVAERDWSGIVSTVDATYRQLLDRSRPSIRADESQVSSVVHGIQKQ